jgi:zinc and cadmium transporter
VAGRASSPARDALAAARTLLAALLISDALHNVADGAAIAAAYLASPRAGIAVALAVISHELPQEVGDYALLRASGMSRRRALLSLTAVQLSALIGALAVAMAAERSERAIAAVLSIAAGTFLYIGATDLLPGIHAGRTRAERLERLTGFLAGVGLIVLASTLLG